VGAKGSDIAHVRAFTEHWNGSSWTEVPAPNVGGGQSLLLGVWGASSDDVWATGWFERTSRPLRTLAENWDGAKWTPVRTPNVGTKDNLLEGIGGDSGSDVWAVGEADVSASVVDTLTERWDGLAWTVVSSPSQGSISYLQGVAATSSSNAVAVGEYTDATGSGQALAERWDGTVWGVTDTPVFGTSGLEGISATSPSDMWAAGAHSADPSAPQQPLITHWDGASWAVVSSPDPGNGAYLRAVSADSASDAWAVGVQQLSTSGGKTLTMHFCQ
jgi:hypothetical protein